MAYCKKHDIAVQHATEPARLPTLVCVLDEGHAGRCVLLRTPIYTHVRQQDNATLFCGGLTLGPSLSFDHAMRGLGLKEPAGTIPRHVASLPEPLCPFCEYAIRRLPIVEILT